MLSEHEQESKFQAEFPSLVAFADLLKEGKPVSIAQLIESGIVEIEEPDYLRVDEDAGTFTDAPPDRVLCDRCTTELGNASETPTPLTTAEKAFAQRFLLVDRRLQFLQEIIAQQAIDLRFERDEHQGEIDALSQHFLSQLAEIRAAQTVDNCQTSQNQSDLAQAEKRLEELETDFGDFEATFQPAPSPTIQWVRAVAFLLTGAALALIAASAIDYVAVPKFGWGLKVWQQERAIGQPSPTK